MDPIGIIGIAVSGISILITMWQTRKAALAEQRLEGFMHQLPQQLVQNVTRFIATEQNGRAISSDYMSTATYADVDNDGRDELLVQFAFGLHGTAIQIYKIDSWNSKLIYEWSTDVPVDLGVEDVDGDGRLEIRFEEVNRSSGYPYVYGLRDTVWYRFENGEFREVKREEPSRSEIGEAEQRAADYDSQFEEGGE